MLVQNVDAVVKEPLELLAQPAIAFQRQGAVPLAVLRLNLLSVLAHDGQQLAAGVDDDGFIGAEVLPDNVQLHVRASDTQVLPQLIVITGLGDAGGHVQHIPVDALSRQVHVDVERTGRGQRKGGFPDAGITGNQHTDFLVRKG